MPNPYFKFKQFTINHSKCAMKVGTDGCLLGAWATAKNPKRILDIGAGTGLIGLMLAQRYAQAQISLVEVENECAKQAVMNCNESPWAERLSVENRRIQNYAPPHLFDLIVSNPPYFNRALAAPNTARHTARHDDQLSAQALMASASKLLKLNGALCIIIPTERLVDFKTAAKHEGLFLNNQVDVKPTPNKPTKRHLLRFNKVQKHTLRNELVIELNRGHYSHDFTQLLKDYYLYL